MNNFYYFNPTKIIFGKEMISRINKEMNDYNKILLLYGQGSIKRNGIHQKVLDVLAENNINYVEFSGIEPNPDYITCRRATEFAKQNNVDFILAVGGGSVIDAAKFISISYFSESSDPWQIVTQKSPSPLKTVPIGCIVTTPGAGSEMNNSLILSRREIDQKIAFSHIMLYPKFSVLAPEFTFSLTPYQTALGIVDIYTHALEQYLTYPTFSLLQDRQAEAILSTLIEVTKLISEEPDNFDLRSTVMWCSAQALNGTLSRGTVTDWSTHEIGHILTALFDIPHAQTLAIVLGGVCRSQFANKLKKLAQYGRRVWHLDGSDDYVANKSIDMTEGYFEGIGLTTRFSPLGMHASDIVSRVRNHLENSGFNNLGEHKNIDIEAVCAILASRE